MEAVVLMLITKIAIPVVSAAIMAGIAYGVKLLRGKIKLEEGKIALDQVDHIVSTVVGDLTQTVAKGMRAASADGHLSNEEKTQLKRMAIATAERTLSDETTKLAARAVPAIHEYIGKKVEATVREQKR